jgi:hypothetical protein
MGGAGYWPHGWRAERWPRQVGHSLKDPLHVTPPFLHGPANVRTRRLPVLKRSFCVSTVSIVSGRAPGSTAVVAGCIYCPGRRLARRKIGADDADGADGSFGPRADPDHPSSGSTFTTEGDVDVQHPAGPAQSLGSVAVLGHDFSRLDIDNALDCSLGFPLGAPEGLRRPSARGDKPLSELW